MFKNKNAKPRRAGLTTRGRRPYLIAPAALAAVLAGGDAAADENDSAAPGSAEVAKTAAPANLGDLRGLIEEPDRERRIRIAALLPELLMQMSPLERVDLVAGWATSSSPHLRLAIARTLRHLPARPSIPGSITAIEHLADDPDPSVRAAVAEAAWLRRRESPARLIAVLHRLADDDNLFVREAARLALGDV